MPFSVIGSVLGGLGSYLGAKRQARSNVEISRRQMDFQREMSSSAYQRSMADMRSAGLNPMLAYKQGGASTPSGAGIPAVDPIGAGVSTAMQARRLSEDLKNIKAQTNQADWAATASAAQSSRDTQMMQLLAEQTNSASAFAKTNEATQELLRKELATGVGSEAYKKGLLLKWLSPVLPVAKFALNR